MGQGGVGKTAMVLRFTTGDFNEKVRCLRSPAPACLLCLRARVRARCAAVPHHASRCLAPPHATPYPHRLRALQYMPTIGDMYTKDIEVEGLPRHVEIDDTAGQVGCVEGGRGRERETGPDRSWDADT